MAEAADMMLPLELLDQLEALPIERGRPLLAVDCDEVLVHLSEHLCEWLRRIGYRMELVRYQLEGSIFPARSDVPVPFAECLDLIDRFFSEETLRQRPIPGASAALARLAEHAQVLVLTNVPRHATALRRRNLEALGMGYPLVENAGGKGRALAWLERRTAAPVIFIDDSPRQHESAARRAPAVTRVHFAAAPHVRRLLPSCAAANHRAENWRACEKLVLDLLGAG